MENQPHILNDPVRLDIGPRGARTLHAELWLPQPIDTVFPFFADAGNLEAITPPLLHFRILTPRPIEMRVGALIDYRLRVRGIPVTWRTRISAWEPSFRFIDEQIKGPYRTWVHEHTFEEKDGGTLCRDRVDYLAPGGSLISRLFVDQDVQEIFRFRHTMLENLFAQATPEASLPTA
jgi:ligand-binding SRPBCC domain-containing protein